MYIIIFIYFYIFLYIYIYIYILIYIYIYIYYLSIYLSISTSLYLSIWTQITRCMISYLLGRNDYGLGSHLISPLQTNTIYAKKLHFSTTLASEAIFVAKHTICVQSTQVGAFPPQVVAKNLLEFIGRIGRLRRIRPTY